MKRIILVFPLRSLMVMALMVSVPFFCLCSEAGARGGGGFVGGGSVGGGFIGGGAFSGGSFRSGGGWAAGPRGGGFIAGRQGGIFIRTPQGGEFFRVPHGEGAARGPHGGVAVRGPKIVTGPHGGEVVTGLRGRTFYGGPGRYGGAHIITAPGNWGPYYGPTWSPAPPAFAGGGVTVLPGMILTTLPAGVVPRIVAGTRYYFGSGVYYLPCYQGSELAYCVVPDPNQ
jgi:hypothetical protein